MSEALTAEEEFKKRLDVDHLWVFCLRKPSHFLGVFQNYQKIPTLLVW